MKLYLFVALSLICNAYCVPLEKRSQEADLADETLPIQCRGITGEDASKVFNDREDCRRVYENEYIKWSEKMLADADFVAGLEVVNTSDDALSRTKRGVQRCPDFTDEYLRENAEQHSRSTSPWRFVVNTDENRIPVHLLDSRCRCTGCINLRTKSEDDRNMLSMPIPVTVPVRKNGKLTTAGVTIGCSCVIPVHKSSNN